MKKVALNIDKHYTYHKCCVAYIHVFYVDEEKDVKVIKNWNLNYSLYNLFLRLDWWINVKSF